MRTVIIKYNAGNVRSVEFALQRLGITAEVTDAAGQIISADRVILPGVGEAGSAMKYLKEKELDKVITGLRQPVLGICLGMQLLCDSSEEGDTKCLGVFDQKIRKFPADNKVPQIGWNRMMRSEDALFSSLAAEEYMYFVHSYYAELTGHMIARTNYGFEYSSAIRKNNFYGVQFHPEKSGKAGEKVIENFLKLS